MIGFLFYFGLLTFISSTLTLRHCCCLLTISIFLRRFFNKLIFQYYIFIKHIIHNVIYNIMLTQQVYRSDMCLLVVHEFMCCSDVSDVDALAQVKYMSRALPY